ncbi:MAG: DoxX family membrane protein [Ignavibacteriales bacterium]|nr:DoxX family membrane protein [Ignavibacteriales bacterium]
MNNFLSNKYLLLILRVIVGFVFLYAGAQKINSPSAFAESINAYKLFPEILINFFAVFIPWLEVVSGLMLIFGIAVRENSFIISSLLTLFILLIVISMFRGLEIDCGCFGDSTVNPIGFKKLVENIVLLLMSILLMIGKTSAIKLIRD